MLGAFGHSRALTQRVCMSADARRVETGPASMTRVEICSLVGEGGKPCRADVDSRTSSGLLAISVGERSNAASLTWLSLLLPTSEPISLFMVPAHAAGKDL
jgi:hypothetical protein